MGAKLNTEEFINRAAIIHNNYYDYSKVIYTTNKVNVTIICPEHGEFQQLPNNHLRGAGCKICFDKLRPTFKRDSTKSFINKAKITHGDKYSYDKVDYTNSKTKVVITCPIHGDFEQVPVYHLSGNGCPKCNKSNKLSMEQITERLFNAHGNALQFFNYSDTTTTKERIICNCRVHGTFHKRLEDLLQGQGCPRCINPAGYDRKKLGTIYLLNIIGTDFYKIGITNKSVERRYSYADKAKFNIVLELSNLDGGMVATLEQHILKKYSQYKYQGPNILESGNTELLHLSTYIKELVLWDLNLF